MLPQQRAFCRDEPSPDPILQHRSQEIIPDITGAQRGCDRCGCKAPPPFERGVTELWIQLNLPKLQSPPGAGLGGRQSPPPHSCTPVSPAALGRATSSPHAEQPSVTQAKKIPFTAAGHLLGAEISKAHFHKVEAEQGMAEQQKAWDQKYRTNAFNIIAVHKSRQGQRAATDRKYSMLLNTSVPVFYPRTLQ